MKSKILLALLAVLLVVAFASCSYGGDNALIGTWSEGYWTLTITSDTISNSSSVWEPVYYTASGGSGTAWLKPDVFKVSASDFKYSFSADGKTLYLTSGGTYIPESTYTKQ
jgi:hypothetical protein